jgi:AcrR family transcriptional regulator
MTLTLPVLEQDTLRERLIVAGIDLTVSHGWAWVTMERLAGAVGVSRRTVYNEVGTRHELAEAMVMHELARFLGVVTAGFDEHPDDLIAAIRAAATGVLELAERHPLLRSIVAVAQGGSSELLPLLTTESQELIDTVKAVILPRLVPFADVASTLDQAQLDFTIETLVRHVVSSIVRPDGTPEQVGHRLAWLCARVLASTDAQAGAISSAALP